MWALLDDKYPVIVTDFSIHCDLVAGMPGMREWRMLAHTTPARVISFVIAGEPFRVVCWFDETLALALSGKAHVAEVHATGKVSLRGASRLTYVRRDYPHRLFAGLSVQTPEGN